jgi:hypothetical protein
VNGALHGGGNRGGSTVCMRQLHGAANSERRGLGDLLLCCCRRSAAAARAHLLAHCEANGDAPSLRPALCDWYVGGVWV